MKRFFAGDWSVADLVRFHTREKLFLLAHDRQAYDRLGRLVAGAGGKTRDELAAGYQAVFSRALEKKPKNGQQVNVLQHILGHFKKLLRPEERAEISAAIEAYRSGAVALDVPVSLFREQARRHQLAYLANQSYLETRVRWRGAPCRRPRCRPDGWMTADSPLDDSCRAG